MNFISPPVNINLDSTGRSIGKKQSIFMLLHFGIVRNVHIGMEVNMAPLFTSRLTSSDFGGVNGFLRKRNPLFAPLAGRRHTELGCSFLDLSSSKAY